MPNRLANETSPYLLQHRDNPVDWYPWGDEALQKARDEQKPVFLSIGYSSCHWCHVMERESFENDEIAELMNKRFVNIKVDREERPDIDSIYMAAVQAMTGGGGWPMSVFLAPDGAPFFAGTYFPPENRGGMPAFPTVLSAIAEAYSSRREELLSRSADIVQYLNDQAKVPPNIEPLTRDLISSAYRALADTFDAEHGGFGRAPKFPSPMICEFLLRYWHSSGDPRPLEMAELTLQKMARGGMYDQIGGGFHRYSTDALWLVPHFEKMLYDNALLVPLYLHAWQATRKDTYRRTVDETLRYVEREMLDPAGGFYSSQDADSEGEEGRFFVWEGSEIDEKLGLVLSRIARSYYDVTNAPNFEGRSILWIPHEENEVAAELNITVDHLRTSIDLAREKLLAARELRTRPARDDKVLTSWNALMMKAFAEAGAVLEVPAYVDIARRNASFILRSLQKDGRLLRTWKASERGGEAKLKGYLEDYAHLIDALCSLYEATFEQRWLDEASSLAGRMIDLFWDKHIEVFFDTGSDHEQLLVRPRELTDNATPSGGSSAAVALLRLTIFTGNHDFQPYAVKSIRSAVDQIGHAPSGFAHWLGALDFYLSTPKEIVVIGRRSDPATQTLVHTAFAMYLPNRAIAGAEEPLHQTSMPLLKDRTLVRGQPTAYVCENYTCQLAVTDPEALTTQLSN